jgi:hypothetical protein
MISELVAAFELLVQQTESTWSLLFEDAPPEQQNRKDQRMTLIFSLPF